MSAVFPSAIPADSLHGDEDQGVYSVEEEAFLVHRTQELIDERLNDTDMLCDLIDSIDGTEIKPRLARALINLDRAIKGERAAQDARDTALSQIQRILRAEALIVWTDACRREAERQLEEECA